MSNTGRCKISDLGRGYDSNLEVMNRECSAASAISVRKGLQRLGLDVVALNVAERCKEEGLQKADDIKVGFAGRRTSSPIANPTA